MGFARLVPPAISVHDVNSDRENRRLMDASQRDAPNQNFTSSAPMPIPSKDMSTFAPPPLPPPPRINDLENGHDTGWLHANPPGSAETCKLAPINQSSTLYTAHQQGNATRGDQTSMEIDDQSSLPSRSPDTQIKIEPPPPPSPAEGGVRNPGNTPGM